MHGGWCAIIHFSKTVTRWSCQSPISLTIFPSIFKFDGNSFYSYANFNKVIFSWIIVGCAKICCNLSPSCSFSSSPHPAPYPRELLHKSHNAPVPYPTLHHFVTEVHISVTKWCIVEYLSDALWELWDESINTWPDYFSPCFYVLYSR